MSIQFVYVRVKFSDVCFIDCIQSLQANARISISSKPISAVYQLLTFYL